MKKLAAGFGLIELMICIVLSLFIAAGLYSMLVSSQQSYAMTSAHGSLNSSTLRVNQLLQNYLNEAGFVNFNRHTKLMTMAASGSWASGQAVFGEDNLVGDSTAMNNTDRLSFRFYGSSIGDNNPTDSSNTDTDQRMFDCGGHFLTNQDLVQISLYVDPDGNLTCADSNNNKTVLLSGVENLQFRYRMSGASQQFQSASNISSASGWGTVTAVEYGVLISENSGQNIQSPSGSLTLLNETVQTPADAKVRQPILGCVALKN